MAADPVAEALATIDGWDVPHATAVLVRPGADVAWAGDAERTFRLASVTKLITALACLVAVEEGTLDLDEPAATEGATVRHLLAHAAGYGFDTGVLMPPETKRVYSNTGFDALAAHLATNSGMDAVDYVTAAVIEPLAMGDTDVRDRSLAHGAWSTGQDMARFAAELLSPTLVGPETLAAATSVQFPGLDGILPGVGPQRPNDWGLGIELRDHKSPHWTGAANSPATFGHFGGAGTFLWVDPAVSASLVVLTDRAFDDWALEAWPPLSDAVLAAITPR